MQKPFQGLLAEYPKSDSSAEAAYYLGVSRYKGTHNAQELKKTIQHFAAGLSAKRMGEACIGVPDVVKARHVVSGTGSRKVSISQH